MAAGLATLNGTTKPKTGEQTKSQGLGGGVAGSVNFGFFGSLGVTRGTYQTYRRMRNDPTIALARVVASAPIKAAQHSWEAEDGTPDDWVEAAQEAVDKVWKHAVRELLWALDYGWKGCEIVWGVDEDLGLLAPERIKPLAVDYTEILTDAQTGNYTGLRNSGVDLGWGKSLYFGNDVEDQDYYGRARNENIRENAWGPWLDLCLKQRNYFAKAAGVLPMVRYPEGMGRDANGNPVANHELAQKLVASLSTGGGVYFPFEMAGWVEDALAKGAKIDDISSWAFSFVETSAGHGAEFLDTARYYDSLKMRGWLVPERAATEGQSGTKAEAVAHGDVGVLIAEETHVDIVESINVQLVDAFLAYNFGPKAKGKVYAVATPLLDSERELARKILETVLTNPANLDMTLTALDFDAMLDREGLPKGSQIVDPVAAPADPNAPPAEPVEKQIAASLSGLYARLNRGKR